MLHDLSMLRSGPYDTFSDTSHNTHLCDQSGNATAPQCPADDGVACCHLRRPHLRPVGQFETNADDQLHCFSDGAASVAWALLDNAPPVCLHPSRCSLKPSIEKPGLEDSKRLEDMINHGGQASGGAVAGCGHGDANDEEGCCAPDVVSKGVGGSTEEDLGFEPVCASERGGDPGDGRYGSELQGGSGAGGGSNINNGTAPLPKIVSLRSWPRVKSDAADSLSAVAYRAAALDPSWCSLAVAGATAELATDAGWAAAAAAGAAAVAAAAAAAEAAATATEAAAAAAEGAAAAGAEAAAEAAAGAVVVEVVTFTALVDGETEAAYLRAVQRDGDLAGERASSSLVLAAAGRRRCGAVQGFDNYLACIAGCWCRTATSRSRPLSRVCQAGYIPLPPLDDTSCLPYTYPLLKNLTASAAAAPAAADSFSGALLLPPPPRIIVGVSVLSVGSLVLREGPGFSVGSEVPYSTATFQRNPDFSGLMQVIHSERDRAISPPLPLPPPQALSSETLQLASNYSYPSKPDGFDAAHQPIGGPWHGGSGDGGATAWGEGAVDRPTVMTHGSVRSPAALLLRRVRCFFRGMAGCLINVRQV